MEIDIGSPAISRASTAFDEHTQISLDNPANASGTITKVEVYCADPMEGLRVGTFYLVSGTTYKCRASVALEGVIPIGWSEHEVSLAVVEGDLIGTYAGSNEITRATSGLLGVLYYAGEAIDPGDEASYSTLEGDTLSLYGIGTETPAGWTGKVSGVTNPAKVMGVDVANIAQVKGVA